MKIVHVIESIDPAKGGPSQSTPSLAAAQALLGHNVVLIFEQTAANQSAEKWDNSIPHLEKLEIVGVLKQSIVKTMFTTGTSSTLDAHIASCDIVHLHGVWDAILSRAVKLARLHDKPYVIAPRGMLNP